MASEINWDEVTEDAKLSPRGILSEWLERADEIMQIIIVVETKEGIIEVGWSFPLEGHRSSLSLLGLLDTAKYQLLQQQEDAK